MEPSTSFASLTSENASSDGSVTYSEPAKKKVLSKKKESTALLIPLSDEEKARLPNSVRAKLTAQTPYPARPENRQDRKAMGLYYRDLGLQKLKYVTLVREWLAANPQKRKKPQKPVVVPPPSEWKGDCGSALPDVDYDILGNSHVGFGWHVPKSNFPSCLGTKQFSYYQRKYVPSFQWALAPNSPFKGEGSVIRQTDLFLVASDNE